MCGPNGSGKSNVADAVRWALGEQSARAIRGRRGEDVIFVGSQGRQPLGLAEVSLTLDNAEGRIPLDYQEVKVTRRLYRSGEAEYLVNGSKVRLKDIHQWLLHAALDAESYVVVGQGSVDELILQRPEERRVVIDNAADIRRHQTRLHETRTRLAGTEENLLRCRAVIAELEPHVTRLRAQAERAERAQVLRAELGDAGRPLAAPRARRGAGSSWVGRAPRPPPRAQQAERQEAELADLEALARQADQVGDRRRGDRRRDRAAAGRRARRGGADRARSGAGRGAAGRRRRGRGPPAGRGGAPARARGRPDGRADRRFSSSSKPRVPRSARPSRPPRPRPRPAAPRTRRPAESRPSCPRPAADSAPLTASSERERRRRGGARSDRAAGAAAGPPGRGSGAADPRPRTGADRRRRPGRRRR